MDRGWRVALAAAVVLAIGATPASAAKSDNDDLGPLKTGAATVTSPGGAGTFTALAECPKKTKVVGGGFVFPSPATNDILYPLESRREGTKGWRVSAYRIDNGGTGPALAFSAEAYCRSGLGKLSEKSETQTIAAGGGGSLPTGDPVATCGVGKAALSGGFSHSGPVTPNLLSALLYENLMAGKVGWVMRASSLLPPGSANTFTSYVYCQRKGEKAPKTVSGTGLAAAAPLAIGTVITAKCPGKRDAFAGGFQLPQPEGAIGFGLIVQSRHVPEGWHVVVARLAGPTGVPLPFAAYGYCS